ncbi:MAG: F0F1 ATP synthase subunit B [Bacillota bacterium]|nr:F0F1 ATP synthase subunit B [Bacillota bacterium]
MSGNLFTIFATIVNFIILYLFLRHFFFNKVNGALEERSNGVKETIDKANADRAKAESLKLENEEKLKNAKEEGKTIVANYKTKAEKVSDDIVKEANAEAQLIMERARKEAEREKEKAQDEIKSQIVDLAVLVSSKALEKELDENEHRRLIEDFIAKVGI